MHSTYKLLWSFRRVFIIGIIMEMLLGWILRNANTYVWDLQYMGMIIITYIYIERSVSRRLIASISPITVHQRIWIPFVIMFAMLTTLMVSSYLFLLGSKLINHGITNDVAYMATINVSKRMIYTMVISAIMSIAPAQYLIISIFLPTAIEQFARENISSTTTKQFLYVSIVAVMMILMAVSKYIYQAIDVKQRNVTLSMNNKINRECDYQSTVMIVLIQTIMRIMLLIIYIIMMRPSKYMQYEKYYGGVNYLVSNNMFTAIITMALIYEGIINYKKACASGYNKMKTLLLCMIGATYILVPILYRMGLKSGDICHCEVCGKYKYVWAPKCIHCEKNIKKSYRIKNECCSM